MIRDLLITIGCDPRKNPRAGEAVRIAAGVGAWNKVRVHLYLDGPAVLCGDEFADELVNGQLFTEYLPAIVNHGGKILVDASNPSLRNIQPAVPLTSLPENEIDEFRARMDHAMTFG